MTELPKEISDFLDNINEASSRKAAYISYPTVGVVNFDKELNMFPIRLRFVYVDNGIVYICENGDIKPFKMAYCHPVHYPAILTADRVSRLSSYYFNATDFLPLIETLKNEKYVAINSYGVKVSEIIHWDRSSRLVNENKILIQKGAIMGFINLLGYAYHLDFTPHGVEKKLESFKGPVNEKDIREAIIRTSNPIADKIYKRRYTFGPGQWERGCTPLYDYVSSTPDLDVSYARIKELIQTEDNINKKIFALGFIFPIVADVLNKGQIGELSDIISAQLTNNRMCEIGAESCSCADDFDTTTVASAANNALNALKIIEKYPPKYQRNYKVDLVIEQIKRQHPELGISESTVIWGDRNTISDYPYILEQKFWRTTFPISSLEALVEDALANPCKQVTTTTKGHYYYTHDYSDDYASYYEIREKEDKDVNIELSLVISNGKPEFSYQVINEAEKK